MQLLFKWWQVGPLACTILAFAIGSSVAPAARSFADPWSVGLPASFPVGERAPSIAGPSLFPGEADTTDIHLVSGRPLVINFFASWCGPCRIEHPQITRLARENGVTIVGVNHRDHADNGRGFLKELGNPYSFVVVDPHGEIGRAWGLTGVPDSFVVNSEGIVVHRIHGPILPAQLDALIRILREAS